MGRLKRAIAKDASVVACAVDATDIVAQIEQIHQTSAVVTAALGRLSIAASKDRMIPLLFVYPAAGHLVC